MGSIGSEELGGAGHSVPIWVKLRIEQVYGVFARYVQNVDCNSCACSLSP
jgi:hypothetical protein